jgi:hypothetical protein
MSTALINRFLSETVKRLDTLLIPRQSLANVTINKVIKTPRRALLLSESPCPLQQVWDLPWIESSGNAIDEFLQMTHAMHNNGQQLTNLRLSAPGQRTQLDNGAVGLQQINIISTEFCNDQFIQWVVDCNLRIGTPEGACIKL